MPLYFLIMEKTWDTLYLLLVIIPVTDTELGKNPILKHPQVFGFSNFVI